MAFTYVGVVGGYKDSDGNNASGTVKIELPRTITNGGQSFTSTTVTLQNGQIPSGTQVPALNDPGTYPLIAEGYKVTETINGLVNVRYVYVRSGDSAVYLGGTVPAPAADPAAAVDAHEQKADPHPVYLTEAEADGLYAAAGHDHDADYAAIDHDHDSDYAAAGHTHGMGDVTGLEDALSGKADTGHLHALDISDITGLAAALDDLDQRLSALEGSGEG